MKPILAIVHQATSTPGLVETVLAAQGYSLEVKTPSLGEPLPSTMDDYDGAIVFGGPMSANDDDELPFIRAELDWIPTALDSNKPFLGICLGAQMLARVLGATVSPHPDGLMEIGYFPIAPTPQGKVQLEPLEQVYHWHREGFELPSGAVPLAQGETFDLQAFCYGDRAYGIQFHPEITADTIAFWTTQASDQLSLPGAQSRSQQFQKHQQYARQNERWLQGFLQDWLQS